MWSIKKFEKRKNILANSIFHFPTSTGKFFGFHYFSPRLWVIQSVPRTRNSNIYFRLLTSPAHEFRSVSSTSENENWIEESLNILPTFQITKWSSFPMCSESFLLLCLTLVLRGSRRSEYFSTPQNYYQHDIKVSRVIEIPSAETSPSDKRHEKWLSDGEKYIQHCEERREWLCK